MKIRWKMGIIGMAGILATAGCEKKSESIQSPAPPSVKPVIPLETPATNEQRTAIASAVRPYLDARLDRYELMETLYDLKGKSTEAAPDPQIPVIQDRLSAVRGREAREERLLKSMPGVDQTPWIADVWELDDCITQVEACLAEIDKINQGSPTHAEAENIPRINAVVAKQETALKRIEELNEKLGKALQNP